jgi:hypothetical protein
MCIVRDQDTKFVPGYATNEGEERPPRDELFFDSTISGEWLTNEYENFPRLAEPDNVWWSQNWNPATGELEFAAVIHVRSYIDNTPSMLRLRVTDISGLGGPACVEREDNPITKYKLITVTRQD